MADDLKILNREDCIPKLMGPNGRTFGYVPVPGLSLYEIKYVDKKGGGEVPDELKGRFTAIRYAQTVLNAYLNRIWDLSDMASAKREPKRVGESTSNAVGR